MKKILIVSKDLSNQGGVVDYVSMMFKYFSSRNNYIHFPIGNSPTKKGNLLHNNIAVDVIKVILKSWHEEWDCIHMNPSFVWRSLIRDLTIISLITIPKKNDLLVFIHGWNLKEAEIIKNSVILKKLVSCILNKSSMILVLASEFKKELSTIGVDLNKIHVTSTMFDGRYLKYTDDKRDKNKTVLLFLSRFVKEKGCHELLNAYNSLSKKTPSLKLILAGDGPEKSNLEKYVYENNLQDSVEFCGFVRDDQKAAVLKSADIFVFPTYYGEGCPVSLLEAMAAGLPIITTPAGGIKDIFLDGVNGVLLNEINQKSIANAIEELINDKSRLEKIRKINTKIAWEKYEASIVTKSLESRYIDIIQNK